MRKKPLISSTSEYTIKEIFPFFLIFSITYEKLKKPEETWDGISHIKQKMKFN